MSTRVASDERLPLGSHNSPGRQSESPPSGPRFAPDPRLLVPVAACYSVLIWQTTPTGVVLCAALLYLFRAAAGRPLLPPGGLGLAFRPALFWAALKMAVDLWEPIVRAAPLPAAAQAGLLGLRLFLLLLLGLGFTSLVSAPGMGAALIWLLPPPLRRHFWRLGPALAFMARCLPEIFAAAADTRRAARVRGLPDKGPAFWKLALPQIFRLPALRINALATAAAARGLDAPETWSIPYARNGYGILSAFAGAAGAVAVLF